MSVEQTLCSLYNPAKESLLTVTDLFINDDHTNNNDDEDVLSMENEIPHNDDDSDGGCGLDDGTINDEVDVKDDDDGDQRLLFNIKVSSYFSLNRCLYS